MRTYFSREYFLKRSIAVQKCQTLSQYTFIKLSSLSMQQPLRQLKNKTKTFYTHRQFIQRPDSLCKTMSHKAEILKRSESTLYDEIYDQRK